MSKKIFLGEVSENNFIFLKTCLIVWESQYLLTKFGTPLYNKRCNLELPLLPTHIVLDLMDPIIRRMLSQKEVDHFNKSVWETIKCIGSSLGVEDDDSNNDIFYMPPNNPLKPISVELQNCLDVDRGRRHSCILLDYHLKICDHVLYHEPSWPRHPPHVKLELFFIMFILL
jgi:hypothetical protein